MAYSQDCARRPRGSLLLTIALVFLVIPLAAQTATTLSGRVSDPNGNPLPGVRIEVSPGGLAATTDAKGRFVFAGLAASHVNVQVSCIGFVTQRRETDVTAGGDTRLAFEMMLDLNVSDTVTVTASRPRGEVEALNQEKSAENIVDVLPADLITSLPNANVADSVGRLPSVSLERDEGEGKYIQIRGTEARLSSFEIDGVHIPSPESNVRNVKLDIIPAGIIGSLELHKTLQADQDGDAIGGLVNLVTKIPGDKPYWNADVQGGQNEILNQRYFGQGGGTYSTRFGPDHQGGLIIGGSYDANGRGINDLEPVPDTVDVGAGPVPVVTTYDVREYRYDRTRWGATPALDYQVDNATSLFLRGLFSDFRNYGDRWVYTPTAGNFITPTLTDDTGSATESVQDRRPHEQIYSASGGGEHIFGDLVGDTRVSYSHSQQYRLDQWTADFNGPSDVAFGVDNSNPYFPHLTPANGINVNDPTLYSLADLQLANERVASHDVAGDANLAWSHRLGGQDGELKFGVKIRDEQKTNSVSDQFFNVTGDTTLTLDQVLQVINDPGFYRHQYPLGPLPSLGGVLSFFQNNPGAFVDDPLIDHLMNDPNNFRDRETVLSGFAMETLHLPKLTLNFGLRIESTEASFTGFKVINDANGNYLSTSPITGSHSYVDPLPTVNLRYEFEPQTLLRVAYGQGIARPNPSDLPPFFIQDDQGRQISVGNPDLVPTHSQNYDVMVDHYFSTVGAVTAGLFYKDLSDPIYTVQTTIAGGPFDGYTQVQPVNGPHASIFGAEASWQQHLSFLPWGLNGLGVIANYTYTTSRATVPGRDDHPTLLRTTPNLANLGLTYDRGPFSARIAATYNDAYIWAYNFTPGAPLGLHGPDGDVYLYPHNQVDAQATYLLGSGVQILVNLLNINNEVFGFYQGSPRFPIQREFYGRSYAIGIRLMR